MTYTKRQPRPNRPLRVHAECVTLALASLVVAVLIGLVLFVWVTQDDSPPVIQIKREAEIRQELQQYYVPFIVTNAGGGTAESVQVIGELRLNGEVAEMGEQQIDFLSSGEEVEGAFVFVQNPERGDLTIRVGSYKLP